MAAVTPKADIDHDGGNVRFVPKADIHRLIGSRSISSRGVGPAFVRASLIARPPKHVDTGRRSRSRSARRLRSLNLPIIQVSLAVTGNMDDGIDDGASRGGDQVR